MPPDDLGDDPELDALAQSCFDGDLVACDHLYLQSPVDSDYEAYGDTCGGRQEAGTGRILRARGRAGPTEPPSGDPVPPEGLGTDPALDALAQSCYAGDMAACDELYGSADAGSAYQVYGDTCAGRQPENTGRYCTALEDPVPGTGVVPTTAAAPTTAEVRRRRPVADDRPTEPRADRATTSRPRDSSRPSRASRSNRARSPRPRSSRPASATTRRSMPSPSPATTVTWRRATTSTGAPTRARRTGATATRAPGVSPRARARGASTPSAAVVTATLTVTGADQSTAVPSTTTIDDAVPPPPITTSPPTDDGRCRRQPAPPTVEPGPGVVPPPTLEPTGLGTDPALDALAQACYDGEMAACDDLWRDSEPDSAYRNFADTCAGRQPPNSGTWCADAFASGAATTSTGTGAGPTTVQTTTTRPQTPTDNRPGPTAPPGIPDRDAAAHRARRRSGVRRPRPVVLRRRHAGVRRPVRSALRSDRTTGPMATRAPAARSRARSTTATSCSRRRAPLTSAPPSAMLWRVASDLSDRSDTGC